MVQVARKQILMAEKLPAFGEEKTLDVWCDDPRCVVPMRILLERVEQGRPLEAALIEPIHAKTAFQAFGETKLLGEWSKDPRCEVGFSTLSMRVRSGESLEVSLRKNLGLGGARNRQYVAFGE